MYVVNEESGTWGDSGWYSNTSCFASQYVYTPKNTAYTDTDYKRWAEAYWEKNNSGTFSDWLSEQDTLFSPEEMRQATATEWESMVAKAVLSDVHCLTCMGIDECYCDDMCGYCLEDRHRCDCSGVFISINDYVSDRMDEKEKATLVLVDNNGVWETDRSDENVF
jgi:hypothetical protein